jgi:DNA-binding CsgD family transcriptional regulator
MKRGRPPYPDVLTPREWEVLQLIREGLTNEQIAQRLGISERGARYHVSEIISKLGVTRREQAAQWGRTRHLGFVAAPLADAFRRLRSTIIEAVPSKSLALASFLCLAVLTGLVLRAGFLQGKANHPEEGATFNSAGQGFLPSKPCESRGGIQEVTTIEEAARLSTFEPKLPQSIPDGFEPRCIEWFSLFSSPPADTVSASYWRTSGGSLTITQGFLLRHPTLYSAAPDDAKGKVQVGDKQAFWVKGEFAGVECCTEDGIRTPSGWMDGDLYLFWVEQTKGEYPRRFFPADNVSIMDSSTSPRAGEPFMLMQSLNQGAKSEGSQRGHTDIWYGLSSNVLSLNELIEIATSVP